MSHTLEIKNTIMDLTLVTDLEVNDDTGPFRSLYGFLKDWAATALIKEITVIQDGGDPTLYDYKVERVNTDQFIQTLQFTAPDDLDPIVTAILTPGWRLSVLAFESPIRAQLITLRATFGLVSFTVVFL